MLCVSRFSKKIATFLMTLTISLSAVAANHIKSDASTISYLAAYSSGAVSGDVFIRLAAAPEACRDGYYVSSDNPGKAAILSIALSAYHANKAIKINGYDAPKWAGSGSTNTCIIEGVSFANY